MCILAIGTIFITIILEATEHPFLLDWNTTQFGCFHFGLFLVSVGSFWCLGVISQILDESVEKMNLGSETSQDAQESIVILDPNQLHARSDNLDKVRSNLRTGTGILMGVGSALLVWLIGIYDNASISHFLAILGSACLAFMAMVAILFSFRNPTERSPHISLREGLVPVGLTKTEYRKQLEMIVYEKEETLLTMRSSIGLGLLLLMALLILAALVPTYIAIPFGDEVGLDGAIAMSLIVASGSSLLGTLVRFGYLVIGRHFLGIVGASSHDILSTRVNDEKIK